MSEAELLITCPYNKAHSILKGRMQFHLTKCRAQHPTADMVTCAYNTTHIVPRMELDIHERSCPDRVILDRFMFKMEGSECPVKDTVPINEVNLPPCQENWDECITNVSVLDVVKEKARDKGVLINLIGAPKSERKAHRFSERQRFQKVLDSQKKPKETPPSSIPSKSYETDVTNKEQKTKPAEDSEVCSNESQITFETDELHSILDLLNEGPRLNEKNVPDLLKVVIEELKSLKNNQETTLRLLREVWDMNADLRERNKALEKEMIEMRKEFNQDRITFEPKEEGFPAMW